MSEGAKVRWTAEEIIQACAKIAAERDEAVELLREIIYPKVRPDGDIFGRAKAFLKRLEDSK